MCQTPGVNARRELRLGGGVIVECLGCGCVGVEFGTSYLTFDRAGFLRFADWLDRLEAEPAVEAGRRRIQLEGTGVMLSLAPTELRGLAALLREGRRWLVDSSVGAHRPLPAAGHWIH
ncbi:MAG: hypothetical protein AAGE94_05580 [Acidobacteriota bacterium]